MHYDIGIMGNLFGLLPQHFLGGAGWWMRSPTPVSASPKQTCAMADRGEGVGTVSLLIQAGGQTLGGLQALTAAAQLREALKVVAGWALLALAAPPAARRRASPRA